MKVFQVLFILLFYVNIYAEAQVYYKIKNYDKTYSFFSDDSDIPEYIKNTASVFHNKFFELEKISELHYKLSITKGMVWGDQEIVQYDYKPKNKGRFRHVLWLTPDKSVKVKHEIFSENNELLFNSICFENYKTITYYKKNGRPEYEDFYRLGTQKYEDYVHILLGDGLNEVSVFIDNNHRYKKELKYTMLSGNYVTDYQHETGRYIAIGTLPHHILQEILERVIDKKIKY